MDWFERVIRFVWDAVRENQKDLKIDLKLANEETISAAIVKAYDRLQSSAPKKHKLLRAFKEIGDLQSGGPIENFEDKNIGLRPDFQLRIKTDKSVGIEPRHHAIFVEAKVISPTRTISHYCEEGVHRFVRGDYAWRMPQAFLLAYARHPKRGALPTALTTWLADDAAAADVCQTLQHPVVQPLDKVVDPSYVTRHRRTWTYVQTTDEIASGSTPHQPGPIELRHIWLQIAV